MRRQGLGAKEVRLLRLEARGVMADDADVFQSVSRGFTYCAVGCAEIMTSLHKVGGNTFNVGLNAWLQCPQFMLVFHISLLT